MAQLGETFDSFDAIGNREDLEDVIYNISPEETPFISNIDKIGATAHFHEWQTDALDTAAHNAQIEGNEFAGQAITPTARVGNYTQEATKNIIVTDRQRAVDSAGRADELSYQLAKAGKSLKRDMEVTCTGQQGSVVGNATTASEAGGASAWMSTNNAHGAGGSSTGFVAGLVVDVTDGTDQNLTEADVKTMIATIWDAGGSPNVIMVGSSLKQAISEDFSGIATIFKNAPEGQATIVGAADLYVSDFGNHQVVPNRFVEAKDCLILDMDMWAVATLQPFHTNVIAKKGTMEQRQLVVDFTLVARQEAASGKVADAIKTP